jgi:endonuclease/exonuclease/phosphatase family metal-dependent hydrolase
MPPPPNKVEAAKPPLGAEHLGGWRNRYQALALLRLAPGRCGMRRTCSRPPARPARLVSLATASLTVALVTAGAAAEAPAPPLRVVSFNLLHGGARSGLVGTGQDLERRLSLTSDELRALRPDIVGLQEASVGRDRGMVAERLGRSLAFDYAFAPASERIFPFAHVNRVAAWLMNFAEGPGILSRFRMVAREAFDLPRCGRYFEPRLLVRAELETPWGRIGAFSTHTRGDPCHTEAVAAFVAAQRGPLPAILMGDFNATEDSPAITALTAAGFVDAFRAANPTDPGFTVWQPVYAERPTVSRRVDYVFLVPGLTFGGRVLASRVVLNTPHAPDGNTTLWPSDHYGVLAELEVFPRH